VRYHGVFAARSSWRALVTPKPPDGVARRKKKPKVCRDDAQVGVPLAAQAPVPRPQAGANDVSTTMPPCAPAAPVAVTATATTAAASATPAPSMAPGAPALRAVAVAVEDPTMTAVEHWHRILDGGLYAASSRIQWALLLRRTYGIDALRCPTCSGRLRVMATLTEPGTVKKILAHLALPTEPLPRARARDPTGQESFDFDSEREVAMLDVATIALDMALAGGVEHGISVL
jgi:hypothetical protein